jgi:hypothetical protein
MGIDGWGADGQRWIIWWWLRGSTLMSLILVKTKVGHGCQCRVRKNVSNFMIELGCGRTIPMHHGSDHLLFLRLFLGVICCQGLQKAWLQRHTAQKFQKWMKLGLRCLNNEATKTVGFYFSVLLGRWPGDHLQEGLAKFGYRFKP